jgi:two-component system sensor histidine kinase VicK
MPQEELARIFDRFHQIKHPNLSHNGGMGLGLTVVKELVELHNGRIWAESLLGKGSVFHVALPTSQEY